MSVKVCDASQFGLGADRTLFKVMTSSNNNNNAGSETEEPQEVWRSYAEFRTLHEALTKERAKLCLEGPSLPLLEEFPRERGSWFPSLGISKADFADTRRVLLENYLKGALKSLPTSERLTEFLTGNGFPDWPAASGDIDLKVHDLPHASSQTEWWYYNTHFEGKEGRKYSLFVAFFRVVKHIDKATGKKSYAHALNWALTDVAGKKYHQSIILDKDSPAVIKKQLEQGVIKDGRLKRAYMEVLEKNHVPLPDRMFSADKDAICEGDRLHVDLELARVTKNSAGNYVLECFSDDKKTGCSIVFKPEKPPVRHGLDGLVKGHDGDDMFYYCISRCGVTGTFTVDGVEQPVVAGQGWYDHEFGGKAPENNEVPIMNYAWNWAAIQLSNGYELSVAKLVDPRVTPHKPMESRAILIDTAGGRKQPTDLYFEAEEGSKPWTSVRTFNSYPVHWRVRLPEHGIDLELKASFPDQEFMTLIARPGFWEGRIEVTGHMGSTAVTGVGYVERNGFQTLSKLDDFFKAVGEATREAVREVYPDREALNDPKVLISLIATEDTPHYIDGVDVDLFHEGIIAPVRYISDTGGKSWRSYGALACMEVVGGDCRNYVRWLSMPEFMHVGSLIVDDIQDKSEKRRGVDCAHIKLDKEYKNTSREGKGEAVAINAGTAAYFQGQQMLVVKSLTDKQLNRVYEYYFAALRAGHAGQALDILGLDKDMDDIIAGGLAAKAEARVTAVHRLKTAVPAASLARMGALVGGGTDEQVEAIGRYYEAIGIAFQIMDDVLNLRGITKSKADKEDERPASNSSSSSSSSSGSSEAGEKNLLKVLGEDITAGKVTYPVIKAIAILANDKPRMQRLWNTIKSKPSDPSVVGKVIAELEELKAIEACEVHAETLVNDAYEQLHTCIPDSFSKIMLRAFGHFVTEQGKITTTKK